MELLRILCSKGTRCPLVNDCQDGAQCQVKSALETALQAYFQYDNFRPGQLASTVAATHGRDVFVRMATGAGKSLCLFLGPLAVSDSAMGIVISPLIGLMDQQVKNTSTVFTSCVVEQHTHVCVHVHVYRLTY